MCTVGEKKTARGEMGREKNTGYQFSFYPLSSDEFPLMRKNEMLPSREESILSFTCSLCLCSACRSVTALFSFHLPITSGRLLVGCQRVGVISHRSPRVEWTQPLGLVQTHSHSSADSYTTHIRDGEQQTQGLTFSVNVSRIFCLS